jgi:phosphohistidine phosphatase SixA
VTKIILIRHGHVGGIKPERFRGRVDLALTDRGRAEARAVAKRVASLWLPARIYVSPMRRCAETGGAIAEACGVEVVTMDDLNDIDYGVWQWRSYKMSQTPSRNFLLLGLQRRISSGFQMASRCRISWLAPRTDFVLFSEIRARAEDRAAT